MASATYNATNQQLALGNKSLTFDANGNLATLTDPAGTTTYIWDARNRLASLSGPGLSGSFQYDALGRRVKKTVNGTPTNFLYDGDNLVQKLSNGVPTANLLTGLGVDEVFSRTDAAGARFFLPDALGSTLALVDSTGTVQTDYTYEPFGATTSSGTPNPNPFQYTGRENDGMGLYYYRARYYHPRLQRFISQDPIGFIGKDTNLYGYVWNNPVNLIDPFGLYGGTSCYYYDAMCNDTYRSRYYCFVGPFVCKNFPNLPGNIDECIRKCLQKYDSNVCQPAGDNGEPEFDFSCTFVSAHVVCFTRCFSNPNTDPLPGVPR